MTEKHQIAELPPAVPNALTDVAQNFVAGAFECVQSILYLVTDGPITNQDSDLYRAAIAFAGAGLDSSVKRLLLDALPTTVDTSNAAHGEFATFTQRYLVDSAGIIDRGNLAETLTARDSRQFLLDRYLEDLTRSSLQSVEQLKRACKALGLSSDPLFKDLDKLRVPLRERNKVVHELDLQKPEKQGDRSRKRRSKSSSDHIEAMLHTAQRIVNAAAKYLNEKDLRI